MLELPDFFILPDLTAITEQDFELKVNEHQPGGRMVAEQWLRSMEVYEGENLTRFLDFRFDIFGALTFPDADMDHLAWGIQFFFWAFAFDDLADEGPMSSQPLQHKKGVNAMLRVLTDGFELPPKYPYARMLFSLWNHLQNSATPGVCRRFAAAVKAWTTAQNQQCSNRKLGEIMPIEDFIVMRRHTIGVAQVEAMVEYSLDLDLPDEVFDEPVMQAMSKATNDLMTWPNDLISFNKEQAEGDYQNLVVCVMNERGVDLQEAVDIIVQMLRDRLDEYLSLKVSLRSFGPSVDREVSRYLRAMEQFVQGTIEWYYSSRYFRDLDISVRDNLIVPIFAPKHSSVHSFSDGDTDSSGR